MTTGTTEERRTPDNDGGTMSVEQIERELAMLRMNDDGTIGLRSSVLNLIVVTSEEDAPETTQAINELADRYPSRVIILISDPDGERNLDIQLTAFCSMRAGARQHICSEQITVHAEGPPASHLDSVAGPLLMPDLPTYLFCPGEFDADSPAFTRVAALARRIIFDSNSAGNLTDSFREAAKLTEDEDHPPVGDLQWATLAPWRSLTGDFFGSPERAKDVEEISSIEVAHALDGESRAMLFVGWTSYVFGWKPVSAEESGNGRRFVFEKPSGGEAEVTFSPLDSETAGGGSLSEITLRSPDLEFAITRPKGREEVCVRVKRDDRLVGESTARLSSFHTAVMLGQELKNRGRDRTYENSLKQVVEVLNL